MQRRRVLQNQSCYTRLASITKLRFCVRVSLPKRTDHAETCKISKTTCASQLPNPMCTASHQTKHTQTHKTHHVTPPISIKKKPTPPQPSIFYFSQILFPTQHNNFGGTDEKVLRSRLREEAGPISDVRRSSAVDH